MTQRSSLQLTLLAIHSSLAQMLEYKQNGLRHVDEEYKKELIERCDFFIHTHYRIGK